MPQDKDRLYVALHARGGAAKMPGKEDTYHWALICGPKNESPGGQGVRYHCTQKLKQSGGTDWEFEEHPCPLQPTNMLLIRVIVGKIDNRERLCEILRRVPVPQGQSGWNCVSWVQEAITKVEEDKTALGTKRTRWPDVRNTAMTYCQKKKDQHRFDGKGDFDMSKIPTFDLLENKEIVQ